MKVIVTFLCSFLFLNVSALRGWWTNGEIYDIYLPSYKDSNDDGIGDFQGLRSKLSHINDLGIQVIKLSTIFPTDALRDDVSLTFARKHEEGGVTDYQKINPLFGTLEDFQGFMKEAKRNGIKVIIEFPINHCHMNHEWFLKSRASVSPYNDYFIWKDSASKDVPTPPNSWLDEYGKSAWKWDKERKQFYYARYDEDLPDLNLKNFNVKNKIKEILRFWLNKGVAGFHLSSAHAYIEDEHLKNQDNTLKNSTSDLPETFDYIRELRNIVDKFTQSNSDDKRILLADERPNLETTLRYLGDTKSPLVHFISSRAFAERLTRPINSEEFNNLITPSIEQIQSGKSFEWMSEYVQAVRLANRFDKEFMDMIITIQMMLPGIARIYYGQEIGMSEANLKFFTSKYANPHALPMQWDDTLNAGFSNNEEPYIMPNPDYWLVNVEQQKNHDISRYNMMKNLISLRKRPALKYGKFKSYSVSKWVYAFVRLSRRREHYLTIANLSNMPEMVVDVPRVIEGLPENVHVVAASINSMYQKGEQLNLKYPLLMRPSSSVVLHFNK